MVGSRSRLTFVRYREGIFMLLYVGFLLLLCCPHMHGSSASSSSSVPGLPSAGGKKQVEILNTLKSNCPVLAFYCYDRYKKVGIIQEAGSSSAKECVGITVGAGGRVWLDMVQEFSSNYLSKRNCGTTERPEYITVENTVKETGYLRFIEAGGIAITSAKIDEHGTFIVASQKGKRLIVAAD